MVKLYKTSVIFLLVSLMIQFGCTPRSTPRTSVWIPSKLPINKESSINSIDQSLLSDMVTTIMRQNISTQQLGLAHQIHVADIATHPQYGPFFFQLGDNIIAVSNTEQRVQDGLKYSTLLRNTPTLKYIQMTESSKADTVILSNEVKEITLIPNGNNNNLPNEKSNLSQNKKIILTPENMAHSLAQFSTWEGIHLDTNNAKLVFVGSDNVDNPQISASDLVTAYKAIFEQEANGKPLFVDMDFNENKDEYLVTFGGGFEDTRPGRVLYTADLLLKALSSGIDPFSNEESLLKSLCEDSEYTPFQKVFCDYASPFMHQNEEQIKKEIDESWKQLEAGLSKTIPIIQLIVNAEGSDETGWEYIFNADERRKNDVLLEIREKGYFSLGNYAYSVRKDKEATTKLVESIFNMKPYQKSIFKETRAYSSIEQQILYATLAFTSPKIQKFLRDKNPKIRENLMETINKLTNESIPVYMFLPFIGNSESGNTIKESIESALAILYFMEKDTEFTKAFLNLSEEDKMTTAVMISEMMQSNELTKMIDRLQYHQPLCNGNKNQIRGINKEYLNLVCNHLSKYKRTYLADLIRAEIGNKFEYKTAAEIESTNYEDNLSDEVISIRYWFYPSNEVLILADSSALNTFLFHRPNMEAKAERLGERLGPYESASFDRDLPGVKENLEIINKYYDELSPLFPTLKELNNLVKMLAFFRWVKYYHNDEFNLDAFSTGTDMGTPTPRTYPLYETVVALPDGSILRAVGGVDLHSKTQVGFNKPKISTFLTKMNSVPAGKTFDINSIKYKTVPLVGNAETLTLSKKENDQLESKAIEVSEDNGFYSINFKQDGKIIWSLSNYLDNFNKKSTIFSTYANGSGRRNICIEDTIYQYQIWDIQHNEGSTVALKVKNNTNNSQEILDQTRKTMEELFKLNVPFNTIWSFANASFQNARLIQKNSKIIFQFELENKDYSWLGIRDENGDITMLDADNTTLNDLMNEPIVISTLPNANVEIKKLQLISTVSDSSLIWNSLGYRNDSLAKVNIWDSSPRQVDIAKWREIMSIDSLKTILESKEENVLITSAIQEKAKGKYRFLYDITNWAFLVDATSNLRAKHTKDGKHFALVRNLSSSTTSVNFQEPWEIPQKRYFVIDTSGYSPKNQAKLLLFAKNNTQNVFILNQNPSLMRIISKCEVIWISCLTEKEVSNRLYKESSKEWLKDVERLRIFNTENPIYDIGNNIFVNCRNLKSIGAWSHVVDFEAMFRMSEILAPNSVTDIDELDKQIVKTIENMQIEYKAYPTCIKLRIIRDLEEIRYSWEEIRPFSSIWKHFYQ